MQIGHCIQQLIQIIVFLTKKLFNMDQIIDESRLICASRLITVTSVVFRIIFSSFSDLSSKCIYDMRILDGSKVFLRYLPINYFAKV